MQNQNVSLMERAGRPKNFPSNRIAIAGKFSIKRITADYSISQCQMANPCLCV